MIIEIVHVCTSFSFLHVEKEKKVKMLSLNDENLWASLGFWVLRLSKMDPKRLGMVKDLKT